MQVEAELGRTNSRQAELIQVSTVASQNSNMNTSPFLINALINDYTMVQALVDSGCLCSGIIDEALVVELNLPRESITPCRLQTAEELTEDKPVVRYKTKVSLDLDGQVVTEPWLYVVPGSTHQIILGKKWLEDQDAIIHSKEQRLDFQKSGHIIYSVKRWRQELRKISRPKITSARAMASMVKDVPVCKATLEDKKRGLRKKDCLKLEDARTSLSDQVKGFAHLFSDENGAEKLPPHRGSLDHAINLRQEDGKSLLPPWGLMYGMSREELLVLQKTLTDLLN